MEIHNFRALIGYFLVGIFWGVTNPFIKRGATAAAVEKDNSDENEKGTPKASASNSLVSALASLRHLTKSGVLVPFLINQCGSLVFLFLLSKEPVSVAAPVCNSLTFVFTAVTGYFIGEEIRSPVLLLAGATLVLIGVYLCSDSAA